MLRVQPKSTLSDLENETLSNLEREGLRHTQFVRSNPEDRQRAREIEWQDKLLDFQVPSNDDYQSLEAVLDTLAGFTRCSDACAYYYKKAAKVGVTFVFGEAKGSVDCILEAQQEHSKAAVGVRTKDGENHKADVVVIAGNVTKMNCILRQAPNNFQPDHHQLRFCPMFLTTSSPRPVALLLLRLILVMITSGTNTPRKGSR